MRLPRLADANGNVSYDELVGLCLTFTFPEGSPENYVVSLTYFDVDEDTVTIASTDELVDAVEQFAEKKVLRLSTEVKPKKKKPAAASVPAAARAPPSSSERGTSTHEEPPLVSPQIKNLLNTFVGVLSTAVSHLQEGLAVPEGAAAPQSRGARVTVTPVREGTDSSPVAAATAPTDEVRNNDAKLAEDQKENDSDEAEDKAVRQFIHGRHTCDSCLVTPIVGKRFHATNLPDYDLCQSCHDNYTGTEVKFEEAELDRDRTFQERWHRRQFKIERFQAKRADMAQRAAGRRFAKGPPGRFANRAAEPVGRRCGGHQGSQAPPCPSPGHQPPFCPPPHHGPPPHHCPPPPPHHGPPPFGPSPPFAPSHGRPHWHHHASPPCAVPEPTRSSAASDRTSEFDTALKEAIRRSLRDIAPKEAELLGETKPSPFEASKDPEAPPEPIPNEDTVVEETVATKSNSVNDEPDGADDDDSGLTPEETKAMEDAMETASVDSEKLLAEDDEIPVAGVAERESSNNTENSRDESFHSEAVGSGDVAEAVGATLDLVAGMISDMLSEGTPPSKKPSPVETVTEAQSAAEDSPADAPGALIMEPAALAKDDGVPNEDEEENEWHVVDADGAEDSSLKADEEIARAAEMLGSALFNSDMKGSDEHDSHGNVSNLSDSFSVPSTVPSINVGATQRSRWSVHLAQLQELGFDNESQCVEILERLQAANIGVESEDDVSVTQVVNIILEQK